MKNLYTYEDLINHESKEQSLKDTKKFLKALKKCKDGSTNNGFRDIDELISDINVAKPLTQDQANKFFSI